MSRKNEAEKMEEPRKLLYKICKQILGNRIIEYALSKNEIKTTSLIEVLKSNRINKLKCHKLVAARVQNVQLVNFSSNTIHFSVKVLDGRRIRIAEFIIQEPKRRKKIGLYCSIVPRG